MDKFIKIEELLVKDKNKCKDEIFKLIQDVSNEIGENAVEYWCIAEDFKPFLEKLGILGVSNYDFYIASPLDIYYEFEEQLEKIYYEIEDDYDKMYAMTADFLVSEFCNEETFDSEIKSLLSDLN